MIEKVKQIMKDEVGSFDKETVGRVGI